MVIRSQDKMALVDTKVLTIEKNYKCVKDELVGLMQKSAGFSIESNNVKLGIYSTKEKALKVLDMMEHFRNVVDANKLTFHMPKDDEVE